MADKPIEQVLKEHTDELMKISGVVGTAQTLCDGEPCILVMAAARTPEVEQKAADVEGVSGAKVEVVWEPAWTPDLMSEAAKLELGMF